MNFLFRRPPLLLLLACLGIRLVAEGFAAAPPYPVLALRITEIMYNPIGGDAYEFLEIQNVGATNVPLAGVRVDGIAFTFPPGLTAVPGARLVLASSINTTNFLARYPGVTIAATYPGTLSNGGERLALVTTNGETIVSVDYDDENGWPTSPDGLGASLEIIDPEADPDVPSNWRASAATNGTPGLPPAAVAPPALLLHEVLADNATVLMNGTNFPDWVELFNPGAAPINLTNWSLTDGGNIRKFVFPSTNVPAGGFLVVFCDSDTNAPGLHAGFNLNKDNQSLFLYDAQSNRVDALSWGPQITDKSIGRAGGAWQLNDPTPGAANALAQLASPTNLVINEWMANPVAGQDDWFEILLRGTTSLPVSLKGLFVQTTNALYQISSLSFIAPGAFLQLIADENPGPRHLDLKLQAAGGSIRLLDSNGIPCDVILYGSQAQGVAQGRLPDGGVNILNFMNSASPGASNYVINYSGPVFNEFMARNLASPVMDSMGRRTDWLELFNPNDTPFDLAGMSLNEAKAAAGKWFFPTGAVIAPHGFLTVWCDGSRPGSTNLEADLNLGRSLSAESGGLYLFDQAAHLVDLIEYGFQVTDLSVGRTATATWKLLAAPTPAATNSAAAASGDPFNLRINEWMPAPVSGNDWFELYSTDALPIELSGLYLTDDPTPFGRTNTQVRPLTFIGGLSWLRFEADGDPSQGANHVRFNLSSFGESIAIFSASLALIDLIDFPQQTIGASEGRFPDGADGIVTFYFSPTPATQNSFPIPPSIGQQPQGLTMNQFSNGMFSVIATGLPLPIYQWRLNGHAITNATNATLVITNTQPVNAGVYSVGVSNVAGGLLSSNATLVVITFDADLDGLPDAWEDQNGFDRMNPADAVLDADGDGASNLAEYIAGTNPHDSGSVLRLEALLEPPASVLVRFQAVSNRSYSVQERFNLTSGIWSSWVNLPPAVSNRTVTLTNPAASPVQRYFRVIIPTPP